MARIYSFDAKKNKTLSGEFDLRKEALAPLKKMGLLTTAELMFEEIKSSAPFNNCPQMNTPIVKDSFLHCYASTLNKGLTLNSEISPTAIERTIEKRAIAYARNIARYDKEFFESRNSKAITIDELFAAAFSHMSMTDGKEKDTYINLIGNEAYNIHKEERAIYKDPENFKSGDISDESKLLHLAIIKKISSNRLNQLDDITIENLDNETKAIQKAESLADHIGNLKLSTNTDIERIITKQRDKILDKLYEPSTKQKPTFSDWPRPH